jgi:DNA polymerase-3 subunit delta'
MLNVQGQDKALALLQRAMNSGRLAHTWIFAGPMGVGKFKTAIELAKTVMCDRPEMRANGDTLPALPGDFLLKLACGACESCRAVESGNHPDLHVISKELIRYHDRTGTSKGTTLSIKVIRGEITGSNDPDNQVEAKIYKRSFRGRGKFFIIDEADLMELPAQNSLLKTLEEPPAESYLIMITASAGELLSTIRSRSQIVTFAELSQESIVPELIGRGMNAEEAQILARLSRGSLGRALRWANDINVIADKNAKAEARRKDDDDDKAPRFTPGGILSWTRQLAEALDALAIGRCGASDVSAVIAKFAAEFAELELVRDKLTSEAEARRRGTALLLAIAAEWFTERMRRGLGAATGAALPGETAAIDYGIAPKLIASARRAEAQIEMNVNEKILLAATTTEWESLLRAG